MHNPILLVYDQKKYGRMRHLRGRTGERRFSCGRVDGVGASRHRDDAARVELVCVAAPSGRHARSAAAGGDNAAVLAESIGERPHRHAIDGVEIMIQQWRRRVATI